MDNKMRTYWIFTLTLVAISHVRAATELGCLNNVNGDGLRHCYTTYDSTYTWFDATRQCESRGEALAAVTEQKVQDLLGNYVRRKVKINEYLWIAGKEDTAQQSWYWINGQRYDGNLQWADDYSTCAVLKLDVFNKLLLVLRAVHCNGRRHFICSYATSQCGKDSHIIQELEGRCYKTVTKLDTSEKTWFQAREYCRSTGGDLATLENLNIASFASRITTIIGSDAEYWVGLRVRRWLWQQGNRQEDMVFAAWSDEQPDNQYDNCLALRGGSSLWDDQTCTQPHGYMCETVTSIPPITTPVVTSPSASVSTISNGGMTTDMTTESPAAGGSTTKEWMDLGIIAAIIVVIVIFVIVFCVVVVIICVKRKHQRDEKKKRETYDNVTFYHYGDSIPDLPPTPMASYADIIKRQEKHTEHNSSESLSGDSGVVEVVDCVSSDNLVSEIVGEIQVVYVDKVNDNDDIPPPAEFAPAPPPLPRRPERRADKTSDPRGSHPREQVLAPQPPPKPKHLRHPKPQHHPQPQPQPQPQPRHKHQGFRTFDDELRHSVDTMRARTSSTDSHPNMGKSHKSSNRHQSNRPPSAHEIMLADEEADGMREMAVDCGHFAVPFEGYTTTITKV